MSEKSLLFGAVAIAVGIVALVIAIDLTPLLAHAFTLPR